MLSRLSLFSHQQQLRFISSNFKKSWKKNSNSHWSSFKNIQNVSPQKLSTNVGYKKLIKPFIFTISFSGCCFVAASIWQYEELKKKSRLFLKYSLSEFSSNSADKQFEIRRHLNSYWNRQNEGQKTAMFIIGINIFVFLLWRIPYLTPMMRQYFSSSPALKSPCLPMILSAFSHHSFFHLAINMYVLYTFSTSAIAFFGKEQFVALYTSSAAISSFTSYLHKVIIGSHITSLGASGALMAILSTICFEFPNIQLAIVFLPFFTFSAGSAIKAIIALDLVGLIARWSLFDHAAHLGGALFGILYLKYGQAYLWNKREHIIDFYQNIKDKYVS